MAIVRFPAGSIEASGNVGDINYTRHRGRSVARAASVPTGSPTQLQIDQQARLTNVTQHWGSTLTPAQRQTWEEGAVLEKFIDRLGQVYTPTGFQFFMKLNLQAKFLSGQLQLVPPEVPEGVYIGIWIVDSNPASHWNRIIFAKSLFNPAEADGFQIFRAGPYNSGGRKAIQPEYRYLGVSRDSDRYFDTAVTPTKWYWYHVRWFFDTGYVGNLWEKQVETASW